MGFKKFGRGLTKRIDSVGKFGGNIVKQQSNNISGVMGTLSNPLVVIGVIVVGGYIALKIL